ncbi:LexA family transcriptional regulator [Sagittula sp. P11]|uniref:LexA family transcriptional regulator n=1 Tax=Sagittula sp. P11 TaxID=2009329 RepID=UPI0012FD51F8|nr:LexA family transcriptional regulator [Sagittula sp. P11]
MDEKWFKAQQKKVGVTAADIAAIMGRDRSAVSHIYTGQRRMSLEWARAFARALQVPLDEVLEHAGALEPEEQKQVRIGAAEGDVSPLQPRPSQADTLSRRLEAFGVNRPGVNAWTINKPTMVLDGYLPGDTILVDTDQSELCKSGDIVVARIYDWQTGEASTILRRYEPPVLIACTADPSTRTVHVVDGKNVAIQGKIIASWRDLDHAGSV